MKIVEAGTIFKEKDERKMEKQQKQFEEIKEAFKDRIVTDEVDINATCLIKNSDLAFLIQMTEKYFYETELRMSWERQALKHGFDLKKSKEKNK